MRVYPLRKNPRKVLLKLTMTSNDQAGLVLTNNFWSDYVKCVPWMSRAAQRKHPSTRATSEQGSRYNNGGQWSMTQDYKRRLKGPIDKPPRFRTRIHSDSIGTLNRYSALSADVDWTWLS
ncbi:hypothetical protein DPMN_154486 [Dreissena polymorpha]|uniref:Uncharacterized protein n=1 Tax=Dreissena polymorpha TaxID=45954 RepID=A0A9D4FL43_DREPO|nr:hypothetical protein DPMN_154486 [Dreissena polymorpha]